MKYIKKWQMLGELTELEIAWLHTSKMNIEIENNELHFTTIGGSHSRVTMPDITNIYVTTYNDKSETMLLLKFSGRLVLVEEQFYSEEHGTYINF